MEIAKRIQSRTDDVNFLCIPVEEEEKERESSQRTGERTFCSRARAEEMLDCRTQTKHKSLNCCGSKSSPQIFEHRLRAGSVIQLIVQISLKVLLGISSTIGIISPSLYCSKRLFLPPWTLNGQLAGRFVPFVHLLIWDSDRFALPWSGSGICKDYNLWSRGKVLTMIPSSSSSSSRRSHQFCADNRRGKEPPPRRIIELFAEEDDFFSRINQIITSPLCND